MNYLMKFLEFLGNKFYLILKNKEEYFHNGLLININSLLIK
jgi:hypothetical protein